jgi:hypothetical protein
VGQLYVACSSIDKIALEVVLEVALKRRVLRTKTTVNYSQSPILKSRQLKRWDIFFAVLSSVLL